MQLNTRINRDQITLDKHNTLICDPKLYKSHRISKFSVVS